MIYKAGFKKAGPQKAFPRPAASRAWSEHPLAKVETGSYLHFGYWIEVTACFKDAASIDRAARAAAHGGHARPSQTGRAHGANYSYRAERRRRHGICVSRPGEVRGVYRA